MEYILTVAKRYMHIPVAKSGKKIKITLYENESGRLYRYFDLIPAGDVVDFIAGYDLNEMIGHDLNLVADTTEAASLFLEKISFHDGMPECSPADINCRPVFHFSPARGWLNDPNGLFYYDGLYHMFFQHNPFAKTWGNMHWSHAVSRDLFHWKELGSVLYPDASGTMFSGSAVIDWKNTSGLGKNLIHPPILLFYTAAGDSAPVPCGYTQCMAYSLDGGMIFEKYHDNPIVGFLDSGTRDPKVIWHEPSSRWIMALYLGDAKKSFCLLRSANLLEWEVFQELEITDGRECPDFFPLRVTGRDDTKWVFIEANGRYLIGSFDGNKFTPEFATRSLFCKNDGKSCYAGQTWSDTEDGRRIFIAWQRGECMAADFSQTMTVPVELSLKSMETGLQLCACPVMELESLREKSWHFNGLTPASGHKLDIIPNGNAWDIELEADASQDMHLCICGHAFCFNSASKEIDFDGVGMRINPDADVLRCRIIIDRMSTEIFADGGYSWLSRSIFNSETKPLQFSGKAVPCENIRRAVIHRITLQSVHE